MRAGKIERRIVDLGHEADADDAQEIGPLGPPPRVPEARHLHRRLGPDRLRQCHAPARRRERQPGGHRQGHAP
jgi:hypothetical protein